MEDHIQLKLTIRCLKLVGFWPVNFKYKCSALLYSIYYKITLSTFIVFVLSQFIELYQVMDKTLEEFSGLMAINLLYTLGLVKIWVIGGPIVKKLVRQIYITEQTVLAENHHSIQKIFMEHVAKTYNSNRLMMALGVMCYFMFMITPTFTEMLEPPTARFEIINGTAVYLPRPLPLVSWFPFDRYKYYNLAFGWHCFAGYFNTCYIVGCNNMFFALMIFAAGQVKILRADLLHLKVLANSRLENSNTEEIVANSLHKIVVYHNAIIRFVEDLDHAMRFFLLLDFTACVLQIAMIGFEVAVARLSFQLLKNIIYLGSMVTQLFLFYWHGNEVSLESVRVADAVWESPWYECNNSAKKTLLQIMLRAQKPLRLSVGSFYRMSTQTMVAILKSSYTYAAVMRQIYSRKLND